MKCPSCETPISKSHLLYGIAVEAQNQGFEFGVELEKSLESHGVEDGALCCPDEDCGADIDLAQAIKSTGFGDLLKACSGKGDKKAWFKQMMDKKKGKDKKKDAEKSVSDADLNKSLDIPHNTGNTGHFYVRGGADDELAKAIEEKKVVQGASPRYVDNWARFDAPKW